MHVKRSIETLLRENCDFAERWLGADKGLITSWEVGRKLAVSNPDLADSAKKGELPELGLKGGVSRQLKKNEKVGCLNYLAQWQGLRGEDLDVHLDREYVLVCEKTGMEVTYTGDVARYANA